MRTLLLRVCGHEHEKPSRTFHERARTPQEGRLRAWVKTQCPVSAGADPGETQALQSQKTHEIQESQRIRVIGW